MNATNNLNLVEMYWVLLKNLSQNDKLELISKLSQSMRTEKKQGIALKDLFGAFQSDKTAEQQIEEIRQSRVFNRQIEEL